jgi:HTH-type transcriptional regulator / antitoxin HigA
MKTYAFKPDYAIPPGVTLAETLACMAMTQVELAQRMGRPIQVINEIIKGKKAIEPETALQLERALAIPASFWNQREAQYQDARIRIAEQADLDQRAEWLLQFPWAAMVKMGYIAAATGTTERIRALLRFFAVSDINAYESYWDTAQASFRQSTAFSTRRGSVTAWLRQGEILASRIDCQPYHEAAFRDVVQAARSLTRGPIHESLEILTKRCAEAGVALVCVPELPGGRESGATRWANKDKAILQLSLRFKIDHQFWFSFFHEAGHILLHRKKVSFIDGPDEHQEPEEAEANAFARDTLIPPREWKTFVAQRAFTAPSIKAFAQRLGIAPGILVGRLMHEGHCPWAWKEGHDLQVKLAWVPVAT